MWQFIKNVFHLILFPFFVFVATIYIGAMFIPEKANMLLVFGSMIVPAGMVIGFITNGCK